MLRSPRYALLAGAFSAAALALTGVVALLWPVAHTRDAITLAGFRSLDLGHLTSTANALASLANPAPFVVFAAALAAVALLRRRPRVAIMIPLVMFAAVATTELLKPLLAHPRFSEWLGPSQIAAASWPSGHATAAMAMALCGVIAVPARLRPGAAALGSLFAVALSYAILTLGWHFPSDVLGGFLVASTWTALGVAALLYADDRWPERSGRRAVARATGGAALAPVLLAAALVGAGAVVVARQPSLVASYGVSHLTFIVGALAIAVLAGAIATGLALALRR